MLKFTLKYFFKDKKYNKLFNTILISFYFFNLSGCKNLTPEEKNKESMYLSSIKSPEDIRTKRTGKIMGGDLVLWNSNGKTTYIDKKNNIDNDYNNINKYLWKSAIQTISFMPIMQSDLKQGLILTDWWNTQENSNERYKINIMIAGKKLSYNAFEVNVFKQIKNQNREWISIQNSKEIEDQIHSTILNNAIKLKFIEENQRKLEW